MFDFKNWTVFWKSSRFPCYSRSLLYQRRGLYWKFASEVWGESVVDQEWSKVRDLCKKFSKQGRHAGRSSDQPNDIMSLPVKTPIEIGFQEWCMTFLPRNDHLYRPRAVVNLNEEISNHKADERATNSCEFCKNYAMIRPPQLKLPTMLGLSVILTWWQVIGLGWDEQ